MTSERFVLLSDSRQGITHTLRNILCDTIANAPCCCKPQVAEAHECTKLAEACVAFAARPGVLAQLWTDPRFLQVLPLSQAVAYLYRLPSTSAHHCETPTAIVFKTCAYQFNRGIRGSNCAPVPPLVILSPPRTLTNFVGPQTMQEQPELHLRFMQSVTAVMATH